MLHVVLTRAQRQRVRQLARTAWIENAGDKDAAIKQVSAKLREEMKSVIGMILVQVAIKLAVALIMKWFEEKNFLPAKEYAIGEPGYFELTKHL